jgi:hypothetical protein
LPQRLHLSHNSEETNPWINTQPIGGKIAMKAGLRPEVLGWITAGGLLLLSFIWLVGGPRLGTLWLVGGSALLWLFNQFLIWQHISQAGLWNTERDQAARRARLLLLAITLLVILLLVATLLLLPGTLGLDT